MAFLLLRQCQPDVFHGRIVILHTFKRGKCFTNRMWGSNIVEDFFFVFSLHFPVVKNTAIKISMVIILYNSKLLGKGYYRVMRNLLFDFFYRIVFYLIKFMFSLSHKTSQNRSKDHFSIAT